MAAESAPGAPTAGPQAVSASVATPSVAIVVVTRFARVERMRWDMGRSLVKGGGRWSVGGSLDGALREAADDEALQRGEDDEHGRITSTAPAMR